jgi:hypothetical protein
MLAGLRTAIVEDDEVMGASLVQRLELEGRGRSGGAAPRRQPPASV